MQSETLRPVEGVLVRSFSFPETATTNAAGEYLFEVEVADSSQRLITLTFSKEGYADHAISIVIRNGEKSIVPLAELVQLTKPTGASEDASNVILLAVEPGDVFVKNSGARETANLTFEARDANDIPVDSDHKVTVEFFIASGPGGGEFVSPDTATTDNNGRAITTLNSGTIAGTVQVTARIVNGSKIIFSEPVPIAIRGGLPDAAHFTIGPDNLNFAGYNHVNRRNIITVLLGDKYSNPVPPLTSVQFRTTGGVIQGSAVTNEDGLASVILMSGNPQPRGVNFGDLRVINSASLPGYFQEPGYALVRAQSVNESGQFIYAETIVLFSGVPVISNVSPLTFNLGPDENLDFTFRVSDQNTNPLTPGTTIKVTSNNGSVTGDNDVRLDDTLIRGQGTTTFGFRLSNSKPGEIEGTSTTVTISVSGDNGTEKLSIFGVMRKS